MTQEKFPGHGIGPPQWDSESLEAAAARRRAELAKDYLLEADVLARLDIDHKALTALRRARKLLAVWHQPDNRYLYPPYQFTETGVIAEMEPLLAYLLEGSTGSGWNEIEWLMTPHALLAAQTPAELLPFDPERVLQAAEVEFKEDRDASW